MARRAAARAASVIAVPAAIGCPLKAVVANGASAGGIPNAGHVAAREAAARVGSLGATAYAVCTAGGTASSA